MLYALEQCLFDRALPTLLSQSYIPGKGKQNLRAVSRNVPTFSSHLALLSAYLNEHWELVLYLLDQAPQ